VTVSRSGCERDLALDGIRGIAIVLVLLQHWFVAQQVPGNDSAWNAFARQLKLLWSGVDLFFVLSGFLIVGILLDAKGSANYFKAFYVRRACRILPLYLLLVATMFLAKLTPLSMSDYLFGGNFSLSHYLTFTQNFYAIDQWYGPTWTGITWSLAIEEQFYLVIPMLVLLCRKRLLATVFLLCIAAAPLLRMSMSQHAAYIHTMARADSLLFGALVALMLRDTGWRMRLAAYAPWAVAVGCVGVWVCYVCWREPGMVWNHLLMSGWFAAIIASLACGRLSWLRGVCETKVLCWFGTRSYGLYLMHMAVCGALHYAWLGRAKPMLSDGAGIAATCVAAVLTCVLAEISFRWFESPILRFGRTMTQES
jgi:peptidoglycan/LPS O-acetylase OafA/YrhL